MTLVVERIAWERRLRKSMKDEEVIPESLKPLIENLLKTRLKPRVQILLEELRRLKRKERRILERFQELAEELHG